MRTVEFRAARLVIGAVWLVTGALSLGIYPQADSLQLLGRVGLQGTAAVVSLHLATTLDILLGLLTIFRPGKRLWQIQAMLIVAYTLIITLRLPEFWLHPFGPILKNLPIFLLLWMLHRHQGESA